MNKMKEIIAALNSELVAIRQKLHSEPELSWEEYETTNYVAAYLENVFRIDEQSQQALLRS